MQLTVLEVFPLYRGAVRRISASIHKRRIRKNQPFYKNAHTTMEEANELNLESLPSFTVGKFQLIDSAKEESKVVPLWVLKVLDGRRKIKKLDK